MDSKEIIGLLGGVFTTFGLIPQIYRLIKVKSSTEISLSFTIMYLTGNALWLIYGITIHSFSILVWNALGVVFNSIMLFLKFRYDKKKV
jgi:MtN3 and saliva related transmembrane protein